MDEKIKLLEAIVEAQKDLLAKKDEIIELKNETIRILRSQITKLLDTLGYDKHVSEPTQCRNPYDVA